MYLRILAVRANRSS